MTETKMKIIKLSAYFIITTVSIITGIWQVDKHFASADDLKQLKENTVQTFDKLNTKMDISSLERKQDFLTNRKYNLRDLIRKYPNDRDLQDEFNEVKEELINVKDKLDKLKMK